MTIGNENSRIAGPPKRKSTIIGMKVTKLVSSVRLKVMEMASFRSSVMVPFLVRMISRTRSKTMMVSFTE